MRARRPLCLHDAVTNRLRTDFAKTLVNQAGYRKWLITGTVSAAAETHHQSSLQVGRCRHSARRAHAYDCFVLAAPAKLEKRGAEIADAGHAVRMS